ncbi:MAG TPA: carbamoyltransferase HypF, partial [Nitrospiria bacterium]|nr:carbamoyltransferase HypF [Nitrospiria bacterium]
AIREPRRSAIGLLWEVWGDALFNHHELACVKSLSAAERRGIRHMLARGIHSPETSSVGRLFDAIASLLGIRQRVTFDGQAAMELEWAAEGGHSGDVYPFRIGPVGEIRESPLQFIDWEPMVMAMLDEMKRGVAIGTISDMFHRTLVEVIVAVAQRISRERVVLGGGCFQNRRLLERAVLRLRAEGFRPFWPHHVPPNDGGLALGQLYVAVSRARRQVTGSTRQEST